MSEHCRCGAVVSSDWARVYGIDGEVRVCTRCGGKDLTNEEIRKGVV